MAGNYSYEQIFAGDPAMNEVRSFLLAHESVREDLAIWLDVIADESAEGQRPIFVARFGKRVVGYMILKPRDLKISSIFVEAAHRGKGCAEALYGKGAVNLGTPQPYTAFVHEMAGEFKRMMRQYNLVLDDTGPLCILNPGDGKAETWAMAPAPAATQQPASKNSPLGFPRRPDGRVKAAASAYRSLT